MNYTLKRLCQKLDIRAVCRYGAVEVPEGCPVDMHPYKVTLRFGRRSLTTPFYMGAKYTCEPTSADVLACLVLDARASEQTFEEFCSDFGYDSDSRKAEGIYRACKVMGPKVRRFLGDQFETFCNAEH